MTWHFYLAGLFALGALATGILHIWAEYKEEQSKVYLYSPLTIILILAVAITAPQPISLFYKGAIILGLILSLLGNIFLMLPGRLLLASLAQFFITHIVYTYAFGSATRWSIPSPWTILLLLAGAIFYWQVVRHLREEIKWPVMIYMIVVLLMTWQALELFGQVGAAWTLVALVGALFYAASDAALAYSECKYTFAHAQTVVLATYYIGQLLIALSIHQGGLGALF